MKSIPDHPGWISPYDHPGRDVFNDDGPCGNDGIVADMNTGSYERVSADPDPGPNHNRRSHERQRGIVIVMGASAKVYVLGDASLAADDQLTEVIDTNTIADR
jgi:hypothetical protein